MTWLRWGVFGLAVLQGVWFLFDGSRALVVGDYLTPREGAHAGQLGLWSRVVTVLGFEPRSTWIKSLHVVLGAAWIGSALEFRVSPAAGWWMVFACAVSSLWYLPAGTVLSLIVIVVLCVNSVRSGS